MKWKLRFYRGNVLGTVLEVLTTPQETEAVNTISAKASDTSVEILYPKRRMES